MKTIDKALFSAIAAKDLPRVVECIEKGADLNERDRTGDMPLHYACRVGTLSIVKHIIAKMGENAFNRRNMSHDLPIHVTCAAEGDEDEALQILQYLVEKSPSDVNDIGYLQPPLSLASAFGKLKLVKFLCAKNADVNFIDENEQTALHQAADYLRRTRDRSIYDYLIKNGADTTIRDADGRTAPERAGAALSIGQ